MEQMTQSLQQRFRATFEQAAVGMAHVAPDGHFLLVNQKLCEIVGYSHNELLKLTFQDITFSADLKADLEYVQQLLTGARQTYSMEKRYIRAAGSLVWVNLTVSLVCDEHGVPQYFISVIEDIDARKRLEEDLARERRAFQMITDNAPDVITRFDRSFRHLYANPAVVTATGKSPDEIIGKTIEELDMPEEAIAIWNAALSKVVSTGETNSLEFSFPSPTGLRSYQSRLVPERDARGEIVSILSITRDVTDFKQTQAALVQSEARARRIIDSNIIGVVITDSDGIIEANDAFYKLIGVSREQIEASKIDWRAITPPEYLPRDEAGLQELRERGVCTPFEKEYMRADGSRVAILLGAAVLQMEPLQWVCFILDITERKRQEQRLQQALDALLTVAEVLVTHKESTGSHEQDISSYEETARQVLAPICQVLSCHGAVLTKLLPASDIIDMVVTVGFDRPIEQKILERVRGQAFSSRIENAELIAQLHRGEVITLDVSQPPYAQRQPEPHLRTCVLVPILLGEELVGLLTLYPENEQAIYTPEERVLAVAIAKLAALLIERERLFTQREEAKTSVQTAQEVMRQMDEFLGIVSHELKTPLTTLQASLQLLRRQLICLPQLERNGTRPIPTLISLLDRAERQIKVQNRLINDLLDVSRIHSNRLELSPRLVNLTQLVQDIIEDQRNLVPTRTIRLETPPLEVLVFADADRVGQVVNNYLSNALKYSEASCSIDVCITQSEQMARVAVTDEGPGLSVEQQERIWQRFYRVPNIEVKSGSGVGLGLGLHICRTIIERQSGQVGVQSALGRGSTFWFTLPLA